MSAKNNEKYSYWCTWNTQNLVGEQRRKADNADKNVLIGDDGAKIARAAINEQTVFEGDGWAYLYDGARSDLYLMFDDGWDVPYGVHPDKKRCEFGSLVVSVERFPDFQGTPAERLKALNDRVKECGWKGAGIWIAAQCSGEDYDKPFSATAEEYWRERIVWCKTAGIEYWKVDWGMWEHNNEFRKFLTKTASELYPELVIEHAICCAPLNGNEPSNSEDDLAVRFIGNENLKNLTEIALSYSDVFRTYDVLPPLSAATTFDRIGFMLPRAKGYLNVEDELYMAASLGCQMGIMRSKFGADNSGADNDNNSLSEITAAVKWQRIAPPFFGGQTYVGEEILFDDYAFADGETWFGAANGKKIRQGAPAVISRNVQLPEVFEGETGAKPFTAFAAYGNGSYSLGVFRRTINGKKGYVGGKIVCHLPERPERIAIFGIADNIEFCWNEGSVKKVTAQSLLDENNSSVIRSIPVIGNSVRISGDILRNAQTEKDASAPAVVLYFE